jgi:hypothetical protein
MTVSVTSPVTGAAQTGLTTPTYTHVSDTAPDVNAKQYAVTALGGTQTGVTVHSASSPFTLAFWRPKILKILGVVDPVTGQLKSVPVNTYKVITRKGVTPLAGQSVRTMVVNSTIDIPAGSDLADAPNVRAALSLHIGALSQVSAGLGDTTVTGIL